MPVFAKAPEVRLITRLSKFNCFEVFYLNQIIYKLLYDYKQHSNHAEAAVAAPSAVRSPKIQSPPRPSPSDQAKASDFL